ncbi:MAG: APC family permease [Verrucomicrobiota bacterium]|nr:APC family permease [Verrucomicrobiota bacterium]
MKQRIFRLEKQQLRRVLGAWDLFSVGYGDVGSSIYFALGATALFALGATPLALLIAGVAFLCTALSYAEMASTFPEPGGSTTFSRYAFNDLISFIAGWGLLLDYVVTLALSAFSIPPYLTPFYSLLHIPYQNTPFIHCASTIAIILVLFLINYFGVKGSGRFSLLLAVLSIITQLGIIVLGAFLFLNLPFIIDHLRIGVPNMDWSPSWWDFSKGCSVAMVAYIGIESIAQLAAETKKPGLTIPRAIKGAATIVFVLYVGLTTVGLSIVTPQEFGTVYLENPVLGIAEKFPLIGSWLAPWVGLIAAIVLLIAANAGMIGCSRLLFSMGEYYQVPQLFYKIHPRFRTPHVTLIFFTIITALIVVMSRGEMIFLIDIYNFGAQIAFCSVHLALLRLRWTQPNLERPYRAPLGIPFGKGRFLPVSAMFGALASFLVWCIVVITKRDGRILGLTWMAIGLFFFFFYRRDKKLSPILPTELKKLKIPKYKPIVINHLLIVVQSLKETKMLQAAFELANQHKAKITLLFILEVPLALPLDAPLPRKEAEAAALLEAASAVGAEWNLRPEPALLRARSFISALKEVASTKKPDLILTGTSPVEAEELLRLSLPMLIFRN